MLNKLGDDMLMYIFNYLEFKQIISASRINIYLNNLVRENYRIILKYVLPNYKINLIKGNNYITFKKTNSAWTVPNNTLILQLSSNIQRIVNSK